MCDLAPLVFVEALELPPGETDTRRPSCLGNKSIDHRMYWSCALKLESMEAYPSPFFVSHGPLC